MQQHKIRHCTGQEVAYNLACATLCLLVFLTTTFAFSAAFELEPREAAIEGNFKLRPYSEVAQELAAQAAQVIKRRDRRAARRLCRAVHVERRARRIRSSEYLPLMNLVCHNGSSSAWETAAAGSRNIARHVAWTSSSRYQSRNGDYFAEVYDGELELNKVYDVEELEEFFDL